MPETNMEQDRGVDTQVIAVEGMTCDHCVRRVEKALRSETGVNDAAVDRQAGRATVTFDPRQTNIPRLHEAIRKAGYRPAAER